MGKNNRFFYVGDETREAIKEFPELFDVGLVHHKFVPPGESVTGHFCVQILQRLHDALQRKRHDKW
jgi:hypothetical protein